MLHHFFAIKIFMDDTIYVWPEMMCMYVQKRGVQS